MDELSWKIIPISKYSISSSTPISEETILHNKFAVASVGIKGTKSELHTARDPGDHNSIVYRFSFVSNVLGAKARLELTTCFTRASDLIKRYKEIPKETEQLMKTSCPVIHLPLDHVHTYEYEIFIAKGDISVDGHYVITQWHGSPDPTILRDQNKCIAQVTMKEIHELCSNRICAQGEIFDHGDQFIGINYNQGGYPPLTMTLHDGYFMITAKSDERVFMEKGGCSNKVLPESVHCSDYPRQQLHILWRLPAKKFKFDRWVKFRWEIKWSKYSSVGGNYSNPGLLTSNALIRVWMDGKNIVNWNGPCGRNDAGRIPYFKIGIYNPSGSQSPVRFYMRRYNHNHSPVSRHHDPKLRLAAGNLTVCAREQGVVNRNAVTSAKKCSFGLLSSAAEKSLQCVLHAEKDYLT